MFNLKLNPRQKKSERANNILTPVEIHIKEKCKKIVAGPSHSYAISENHVYFWGKKHAYHDKDSRNKNLSVSDDDQMAELSIKVEGLATGPNHTFAWNQQEVFCWGSNEYYELGLEEEKQYGCHKIELFEEAMKNGYHLEQIQCGESHTIAIFRVGQFERQEELFPQNKDEIVEKADENEEEGIQMFAWGKSESYQLTINSVNIIPYPVLTPCSFKHLTSIQSKSDYNVAICNYKVYTWGANLFSRLGNALSKVRMPQQVMLPAKIVKIGIGNYHVVAVTDNGEAYSWGKGDLGQLGINKFEAESKPSKLICEQRILEAACGDYHTLIRLQDNRLKTCGGNKNGVLGHSKYDQSDKKKRCKKPQFVENSQIFGHISMIACGNHHNLVLNTSGVVFGWGNNDSNQIAPSQKRLQQIKQDLIISVKQPKKQLEIIIDQQNDKNEKHQEEFNRESNITLQIERLQGWKKRYNLFREQKAREQQLFMREYEEILTNLRKTK